MTKLFRILYCSRNTLPGAADIVAAEIRSILAVSRRNNARVGVTGGLLYNAGCFAQALEGPLEAVEEAFERIQCDDRHGEVTVLQSGGIATRDFPDWSMAFAGAPTADNPLAGIALADAFAGSTRAGDSLMELLRGVIAREAEWLSPAEDLTTR